MNNAIQLEDRVSRSRSKHEGESSAEVCDRLSRTRVSSQRQLPTDHDYAVPTREYQLDQSSPLPATAAADSCPRKGKCKNKNHPSDSKMLTGSHHINFPSCGFSSSDHTLGDLLMGPPTSPRFIHRASRNGVFDSVCLECFATVATSRHEPDLTQGERDHVCDPWLTKPLGKERTHQVEDPK